MSRYGHFCYFISDITCWKHGQCFPMLNAIETYRFWYLFNNGSRKPYFQERDPEHQRKFKIRWRNVFGLEGNDQWSIANLTLAVFSRAASLLGSCFCGMSRNTVRQNVTSQNTAAKDTTLQLGYTHSMKSGDLRRWPGVLSLILGYSIGRPRDHARTLSTWHWRKWSLCHAFRKDWVC